VLLLPDLVHPLAVPPPASECIRTGQQLMRSLAAAPRERLHDLPHHSKQLAITVTLLGTCRRVPRSGRGLDIPFFPRPFHAPGRPDGLHRPAATLVARQLSCAMHACGRAASLSPVQGLVRHQLLGSRVLLRELMNLTGHLRIHHAATTASRRRPVRQR